MTNQSLVNHLKSHQVAALAHPGGAAAAAAAGAAAARGEAQSGAAAAAASGAHKAARWGRQAAMAGTGRWPKQWTPTYEYLWWLSMVE